MEAIKFVCCPSIRVTSIQFQESLWITLCLVPPSSLRGVRPSLLRSNWDVTLQPSTPKWISTSSTPRIPSSTTKVMNWNGSSSKMIFEYSHTNAPSWLRPGYIITILREYLNFKRFFITLLLKFESVIPLI